MNGLSKAAYDRRMAERQMADSFAFTRPPKLPTKRDAEWWVQLVNGFLTGRWLAKLFRRMF